MLLHPLMVHGSGANGSADHSYNDDDKNEVVSLVAVV